VEFATVIIFLEGVRVAIVELSLLGAAKLLRLFYLEIFLLVLEDGLEFEGLELYSQVVEGLLFLSVLLF
jgi:hypothetical protein